jgi:redox-sensitive bicupin YhaK (pirin superfamily)
MNPSGDTDIHFVQMWCCPTRSLGRATSSSTSAELAKGGLVPVASGRGMTAISIRQRRRAVGRAAAGEAVDVPDGRWAHVFVARGAAELVGAGQLAEGDAVRLTAAGSPRLIAGDAGAEVLIWQMG